MGDRTGIQWTEKTWNPWHGCTKVSPGCDNCYMFSEKRRYGQNPERVVRASPHTFRSPLRWKEPALVFTCSWSDWFIKDADPWRDDAWQIIRATPHLTYQILTKRPSLIVSRLPSDWGDGYRNVWLGVSVEDDAHRGRVEQLVKVPAAVRFVSYEPAIGDVAWERLGAAFGQIDWLIVGGESGNGARPFDITWARHAIDACHAAGVWPFVKQLGARAYERVAPTGAPDDGGDLVPLRLRDRKGGDMDEWPEDLRVRLFPEVRCG